MTATFRRRLPVLALSWLDHSAFIPAVVVVAVVARLMAVFLVGPDVLFSDGADYHDLGSRLASTGAYVTADGTPTAYRPVGYPAFLAGLYSIFGASTRMGQLANVLAQVSAMLLLGDVARRTFATERQARIGMLLLALHPNAILHTSLLQTESAALLLTALTAWGFVRHRAVLAVLAGLSWGALVLVKPPYLLLFPMLVDWRRRTLRRVTPQVVLAGVVGSLLVGGWSVRNSLDAGKPVFVSSNAGSNLRIGHNPQADGTYDSPPIVTAEMQATAHLSEWEQSDAMSETAKSWIAANPGQEVVLAGRRLMHLWLHDADAARLIRDLRATSGRPFPSIVVYGLIGVSLLFYALAMLAVVGAVLRRPRLLLTLPSRVAILVTLIHMAFFGSARFHFVPLSLLLLLAPLVLRGPSDRS